MTMIRAWFETTLSVREAEVFTQDAIEHFNITDFNVGCAVTLLRRYLNTLNINIVPPVGSTFSSNQGKRAYPIYITGVRHSPKVDEYHARKHALVNSLENVHFTDRRLTRKITVKPMGYAHTNPIPLKHRYTDV